MLHDLLYAQMLRELRTLEYVNNLADVHERNPKQLKSGQLPVYNVAWFFICLEDAGEL